MFQAAKVKLAGLPYIGDKKKLMYEMKKMKMLHVNTKIMMDILGHFKWHNETHEIKKLLGLI